MKYSDYDLFEVGETLLLTKSEQLYINENTIVEFKEGTEIKINKIIRDGGYGSAIVSIEEHEFQLGLDEIYGMTWE